jgi:uncharacterized membrane-anchored protein
MRRPTLPFLVLPLLVCIAAAQAPDPPKQQPPKIAWEAGPGPAKIGDQAVLEIPEGYLFAPPEEARKFLELTQNIPSGRELGILTPQKADWFVIFEFSDVGYVKDDEKKSLDADAMFKSMKEATDEANEERKRRGWGTMTLVGWKQPPHYDEATHNLEWALEGKDEKGDIVVNHNTRYLGRRGYMSVNLVVDSAQLTGTLPEFRQVMSKFNYIKENDYRSFVKGDKVAEYGLTALIVGGATAAAAKTGLLKGLWKLLLAGWKLIAAALVALGGFIKRLFTRSDETTATATNEDGQ